MLSLPPDVKKNIMKKEFGPEEKAASCVPSRWQLLKAELNNLEPQAYKEAIEKACRIEKNHNPRAVSRFTIITKRTAGGEDIILYFAVRKTFPIKLLNLRFH